MATFTPFLGLRKPTDIGGISGKGDPIAVLADISAGADIIDTFASDTDGRITLSHMRFFAHQSGAAIPGGSGGWIPITFLTEDKDTHNGHSTSSNTSRYTAPVTGSFELTASAKWSANPTGSRGTRYSMDSVVIPDSDMLLPATPGGAHSQCAITMQVDIIVGHYVEFEAWQNSGSSLNISNCTFGVKYIGPI